MTAPDPASIPAQSKKSGLSVGQAVGLILFTVILIAVAVLVVAVQMHPSALPPQKVTAEVDLAPLGEKVTALEQKTLALEARVNELSARLGPTSGAGDLPVTSAANIARMQSDIAALAAGFGGLQGQIKQVNETAAVTLRAARTSLSATLIFMQMRQEAEAGRSFANLLATMRNVASGDATLIDLLVALEPYATSGVPAIPALQEQFASLITPAAQEFDREAAQGWWQRILAELKGLVSIRPLHGDSIGSLLSAAEAALAQSDLSGAIERVKALPPGTQQILNQWKASAEARQRMDTTLRAIAERLAANAQISVPAQNPAPVPGATP